MNYLEIEKVIGRQIIDFGGKNTFNFKEERIKSMRRQVKGNVSWVGTSM